MFCGSARLHGFTVLPGYVSDVQVSFGGERKIGAHVCALTPHWAVQVAPGGFGPCRLPLTPNIFRIPSNDSITP